MFSAMYRAIPLLFCMLVTHVAPAMADAEVAPPASVPINQPATPQPQRKPIVVRQILSIEFGTFASNDGGGSITVSPSGARIPSGNISVIGSSGGGAAEFEITGQAEEIVTIYLPDRVNLNKSSGSGNAVITNLISTPADTVTLDSQGRARVKVGGTLRMPGNITPGSYSGTFDIDVRYLQ